MDGCWWAPKVYRQWFEELSELEWLQPASAGREHFELPQRQLLYR